MRFRSALKAFFFVSFVVICFAQCYTILKNFLEYPTIINMYDVSPSLITILPGITICSNNRLSLKRLAEQNVTIRRALNERFPGWYENQPSYINKQEFNSFRDGLSDMYDKLRFDPQSALDNSTMNTYYTIKPDPRNFIQWLACGRTWTDSIDCANISQIDSARSRICTTILHRGAMLYDVINRPELFNSTGSLPSNSQSYFDAKEVIKLVVDFGPEDYADLKRQIGGRILFHDSRFVAASGDLDFFITRGYRYDFNIDRKDLKLLDEPYGECYDYEKYNIEKFKARIDPRVPLAHQTCLQNCIVRNILHRSKCWPPTMPYFRNDSLDPNLNAKACDFFKKSHQISIVNELTRVDELKRLKQTNASDSFINKTKKPPPNKRMKFYKWVRRNCMAQCVLPCRITEYSVTLTRSAWPTDVKILFDKVGKERALRHCCSLIAIKFTHFHYNVHEHRPKYDIANTIGDLGGLLAVWLGLSIVSVYHAFHKLLELCAHSLLSRRSNSE